MSVVFHDRREAGRVLAAELAAYAGRADVVVLALPRGGVPVAFEIARALHLPLDVFVVRKLGLPFQPEFAMGAVASGGVRVLDEAVIRRFHIPPDVTDAISAREWAAVERSERAYRGDRLPLDVRGKTAILVDDGLATGSTMRAAVTGLRQHGPARIVVAVPVGSADACAEFCRVADETYCARTPDPFYAVGAWYEDFSPTTDTEVRGLLEAADGRLAATP
jgi:putative phosphoribosyl transferase